MVPKVAVVLVKAVLAVSLVIVETVVDTVVRQVIAATGTVKAVDVLAATNLVVVLVAVDTVVVSMVETLVATVQAAEVVEVVLTTLQETTLPTLLAMLDNLETVVIPREVIMHPEDKVVQCTSVIKHHHRI